MIVPGVVALLALACAVSASAPPYNDPSTLPTVDLGYMVQRASAFNDTAQLFNFSNIRYAAPPLGQNRFKAPVAPAVDRSEVQDGSLRRICPQANPTWLQIAPTFLTDYFTGQPFNGTQAQLQQSNNSVTASTLPPRSPFETEDCLFLDVFAPQAIFENAGKGPGAPVLVWIHGGGYVMGQKAVDNPTGLIGQSDKYNMSGIVYVALNYRLGAFGWSPGPTFTKSGGLPNAGLYDQRFALEWVQRNIALFGGDPTRVTVLGESAGGGSVMHQITAYGGTKGPAPFQQAVMQSPGFLPVPGKETQEATFNTFLSLANATTLEELQQASTDVLQTASALHIAKSDYGNFNYGPVVDGTFAPALPPALLASGQFDHDLKVMVAHNSHEGILFTDPFTKTRQDIIDGTFRVTFPTASQETINYILDVVYPPEPQNNGTLVYETITDRLSLLIAEALFVCNTRYLDLAYKNETYAYYFNVPPGQHAQDVAYTFYNNQGVDPTNELYNTTVAIAMQEYITSFAQEGKPQALGIAGAPLFDIYGPDAQIQDLSLSDIVRNKDNAANERCAYWETVPYV